MAIDHDDMRLREGSEEAATTDAIAADDRIADEAGIAVATDQDNQRPKWLRRIGAGVAAVTLLAGAYVIGERNSQGSDEGVRANGNSAAEAEETTATQGNTPTPTSTTIGTSTPTSRPEIVSPEYQTGYMTADEPEELLEELRQNDLCVLNSRAFDEQLECINYIIGPPEIASSGMRDLYIEIANTGDEHISEIEEIGYRPSYEIGLQFTLLDYTKHTNNIIMNVYVKELYLNDTFEGNVRLVFERNRMLTDESNPEQMQNVWFLKSLTPLEEDF